jgi:predicted RNA-binding Zn-ribbon protein involved in translation (DUF1610 family)
MWPFSKKKEVKQVTAGGRIIGQFTALKDFSCPVTGSVYVVNMSYNIREGNQYIEDILPEWVKDKKVRLG